MEEMKNKENFNWELLTKHLVNETNSQEKLEVESWLNQSETNKSEMEKNQQIMNNVDAYFKTKKFDSTLAWNSVNSKIYPSSLTIVQRKSGKGVIAQFYKYAAIIVIAILLGSVGYFLGIKNHLPFGTTETAFTEIKEVNEYVLPDGSLVTLNSNSKIVFPKSFNGNTREVTIEGEAFFDVKHNPEKPFIINAGNTQVKVLGTSFSVRAYPENKTVEVVVKTGKVELLQKQLNNQTTVNHVYLAPGEKGVFFNENNLIEKIQNENENFLAWKTHDLIFNEKPLVDVVESLEKAYHVNIELEGDSLKNLLYTAHFDKKPIAFILDVITISFDLELTEENEQFTLSSRKNEQVKR